MKIFSDVGYTLQRKTDSVGDHLVIELGGAVILDLSEDEANEFVDAMVFLGFEGRQ